MASFSSALKIGDLNDFIAPSQDCIVTLSGKNSRVEINNTQVSYLLQLFIEGAFAGFVQFY